VDAGVGVHQNVLGSETLGTVAGDGVSVVEVAVVLGIEFARAVVVETDTNAATRRDGLNGGNVAICNAERPIGALNWMRCPAENSWSISR
jgi:hypothetical protein